MSENGTTQEKAARKIQGLLALAEDAAKRGNEALRDTYLQKATALQLKYVIDESMLPQNQRAADEITFEDFCQESNTPLIKAKRELISGIAGLFSGKAVMMPEWKKDKDGNQRWKNGKPMYDKRAKIRVYAHETDLAFIRQLYTSLILQMQSMMANDERNAEWQYGKEKVPQAWRVSYAYGWVRRVYGRLTVAYAKEKAEATKEPGTALVLRDRGQAVEVHVGDVLGKLTNTKYRRDDNDPGGRAAGYAAGARADLGQTKVTGGQQRVIGQ